jgi:hypothetical protein
MLQSYSLSIPCKGYVKKYFTAIHGNPIILSHSDDFGDTLLTKLASRPLAQANKHVLNLAFRDFTDEIKFQLPMDFFYRIENTITEQQTYAINRYLENIFKSDLYLAINAGAFFGVERNTVIETFSRFYNIVLEEDLSLEALQKAYQRYRKGTTARKSFLFQMSTPHKFKIRAA